MKKMMLSVAAAAVLGSSGASAASAAIEAAKAQCIVGEQADGYLGIIDPGATSAALEREVRSTNQQRKALYADFAASRGITIEVAAALFAEKQLNQAGSGECIRDQSGTWLRKP
jgi:hypothetical protein